MYQVSVSGPVKGRHGSGNKGNFESGQNKSKVCSYILKLRDCNSLIVTMDTSCKRYFKTDKILRLRTSNSLVHCQLPYPPLTETSTTRSFFFVVVVCLFVCLFVCFLRSPAISLGFTTFG